MKTSYAAELPIEWRAISAIFSALGDPQRQRLVLAFDKGEHLTAGQLASVSPLNRTTVSHHLKILRQAGVLLSEKRGTEVYYWVDYEAVGGALGNVLSYIHA